MRPLTLAEVNTAIAECEDLAEPFYPNAELPYRLGFIQVIACRGVSMYVTLAVRDYAGISWNDFVSSMQGKVPIGLAIERFNRVLEQIPEPTESEAAHD